MYKEVKHHEFGTNCVLDKMQNYFSSVSTKHIFKTLQINIFLHASLCDKVIKNYPRFFKYIRNAIHILIFATININSLPW